MSGSFHTAVQACQGFCPEALDTWSISVEEQCLQNRWHKLPPVESRGSVLTSSHLCSFLIIETKLLRTNLFMNLDLGILEDKNMETSILVAADQIHQKYS